MTLFQPLVLSADTIMAHLSTGAGSGMLSRLAASTASSIETGLRSILSEAGVLGARLLGFAADHAVALGAVGCGVFLVSEVLARRGRITDPETATLAGRLGIDPVFLSPIGDGVQLWRDARAMASDSLGPVADSVPPGAPTLRQSALALTPGGLFLVAVHDLGLAGLRLSPEQPGVASAPATTWDGFTGTFLSSRLTFSVDDDIARRVRLAEAIVGALPAGARRGNAFEGRIRPLVLTIPGGTLAADALREGLPLAAGQTIPHIDIGDSAAIAALTHHPDRTDDRRGGGAATPGPNADAEAFAALDGMLRSQPARMTPRRRVLRRAAVGAACLAFWIAFGPGITPQLAEAGLSAIGRQISTMKSEPGTETVPSASVSVRPQPRP